MGTGVCVGVCVRAWVHLRGAISMCVWGVCLGSMHTHVHTHTHAHSHMHANARAGDESLEMVSLRNNYQALLEVLVLYTAQ